MIKMVEFPCAAPKISIIIPHYNSSGLLKKLLSTIPKSDDIQVIIVDDYSSPDELVKIKEIAVSTNSQLHNNNGIKSAGACRNIGISFAIGRWLLFADADDYFNQDWYDKISVYLESDADVIFFPPTSEYQDTGRIAERHIHYKSIVEEYVDNPTPETELKIRCTHWSPCSKLIKKSLIDSNDIRFDEILAGNDLMFATKVGYYMKTFDVRMLVIYVITKSRGTLTTNMSEAVFDARASVYAKYANFIARRYPEDTIEKIGINGMGFIMDAFHRFGIIKSVNVFLMMRKNGVKTLKVRYFNPHFLIRKLASSSINNYFDKNKKNILNK